ncbi:MAG: hypothetical protein MJK18_15175, partial [Bdellovibrionales bacterium]|nr:hypothetical protein [Bdellovibrionales bacterium]
EISEPQVELLEVNEDFDYVQKRNTPSCIEDSDKEDRNLDINQLINLGKELWQIVKDGEPELNFQSQSATAFPAQAQCLFNLTSWSIPQSRTYRVSYKNGIGSEVISMTYKLIYTFGGQFDGRGNYLANVSIHPAQIYVGWGFKFDAQVHIQDILNIGSAESPEAGMQVALEWSVGNVLNKHQSQDIYFIQGSGPLTAL